MKPGFGKRLLALAQMEGIPPSIPLSETVPLLIVKMKARRDERAMDYIGYALAASVPLGGREALEGYIQSMYSPAEAERMKPQKKDDKDLANEMARAMRIRMMADKYGIKEVRE